MKQFIKMVFASIVAMGVFFIVLVMFVGLVGTIAGSKKPKIKEGSYLVIDFYGEILPYDPPSDLITEIFGEHPETLHRILGNLEKVAVDDRIKGVICKISANNTLGVASIEEIRSAIKKVRDADKEVYAYCDFMNLKSVFLASACDSIFMPRSGEAVLTGLGQTRMYVRGTLDKLGINPNIHRIDEYKSAAEMVTRKDMSPETREMMNWIYDDIWDLMIGAVAEDRGIGEEKIVDCMEYAIFMSDEAKEAGLIDEILYWDELEERLKDEGDKKLKKVTQSKYADVERKDLIDGKKKIAVVHAFGMIGGRKSYIDPMVGVVMGHESMAKELRQVGRNDKIAAVVFRIESPGGESLASDLIGHEVGALAAKKPVIASMVDVAASGGYHIAYPATKIVADPMTITGSIGSISGKFNVAGMYNKLGMTFDHVTRGPNALFWSPYKDFTPDQRKRFEDNHWKYFYLWLDDVSKERGIDVEELEGLAMGRIWTGRQAADNRLIDEVGDLDRAIEIAKELADIPADEEVTIVHYPRKKTVLEMVTSGSMGRSAIQGALYRLLHTDLVRSLELMSQQSAVPEP